MANTRGSWLAVYAYIHEHDECELEWWFYVYFKSLVVAFLWAEGRETELYILHFLQQFVFPSVFSLIETICPKIRWESRPKIAKSPSLSSSTFDKDIGRQESQAVSVRCSNYSSVFLIMWRLFNNPNQEPITLSIFGVVLNTQSARLK